MLQPLLHSPLASLLRPSMEPIGFTPYVLFAGGQQGAWFEPSSAIATPWYQDSAATTPITAVEQPIGNARDKSGNANHAIQATAAARPVLKATGGFNSKLFDGVDDLLVSATGGGGSSGIFICMAFKPTAAAFSRLWSDLNIAAMSGYSAQHSAAGNLEFTAGNGGTFTTVSTAGFSLNVPAVAMCWDDGSNLNVQVNNGAVASIARPAVVAGTAGFVLGANDSAGGGFATGNIYAAVYAKNSSLTAAQRTLTKNYVAQSAGVTL